MAMIQCPECGKEISSSANFCPNCGFVVNQKVENADVTSTKPATMRKSFFSYLSTVSKKKVGIFLCGIVAVILLVLLTVLPQIMLNADEELAYQNVLQMRSMMKNPNSFILYDDIYLMKYFDSDEKYSFTYTVFEYGAMNGYGGIATGKAIFKDQTYLMEYGATPSGPLEQKLDQINANMYFELFEIHNVGSEKTTIEGFGTWQKVELNAEKIRRKLP